MESEKIFVISRQKCGTTSTGQFLRDHGITCLSPDGKRNRYWSILAQTGKMKKVLDDPVLSDFQAFEDDPWWMHGVPEILTAHFPGAKFILLTRTPDDWFDSLRSHVNEYGGFAMVHAFEYDRHLEFYEYMNANRSLMRNEFAMDINESHRQHYCELFTHRMNETIRHFESIGLESSLFLGELDDPGVWKKLGEFLNIEVDGEYQIHSNRKEKRNTKTRKSFSRDLKWVVKDYLK